MARKAAKEKEGIGARVERLRMEKGWTQEELADRMFVRREALKNKELGLRPFTLDEAIKLSTIFNVTIDYLVTGISTENVSIHEKTGLDDNAISELDAFNMISDDKMPGINKALSYIEVLDSLANLMLFEPKRKGYFLKKATDENQSLITCIMSPEIYQGVLEQNLLRVLRLAKEGKRPSWYYTSVQDYVMSDGDEELRLAEPSEFKGAKKNAKKK